MKSNRPTTVLFFAINIFFITLSHLCNAQKDAPNSFRDFINYQNTDSLMKVVKRERPNSMAMLRQLILLEKSRLKNSKDFGKSLNEIKRLSLLHKSSVCLNMYFYLNALFQFKVNNASKLAMVNLLKANDYFEAQKDTTGMIFSNFFLIFINIPPGTSNNLQLNIDNAKVYYEKNITLGKASDFALDKIMGHSTILSFINDIYGKSESYKIKIAFQEAIKIINQNPEFSYIKPGLYINLIDYYSIHGLHNKALELEMEFEEKYRQWSPNVDIYGLVVNLHSITKTYMNLGNYKMAEVYAKKSITFIESARIYENNILIFSYGLLAEIQQKQQKYITAWATRNKKDSLVAISKDAKNNEMVANIQTKYETKKKDSAIKSLIKEQSLIKTRNQLLIGILVVSIVVICLISYLGSRLRKTNAGLLQLQKNRAKLFTIISHDLRSPLSTYQRYSEIVGYLVQTKQFERLDKVLHQINENGFHFASLLNNLLSWSLNQQGKINYAPKHIWVKSAYEEFLPIYREMARLKSVTLIENIKDAEIYVDPNALSLIVRNLLDNAIKYTAKDEVITIQTEYSYEEFKIRVTNKSDVMTEFQKSKIKMLFETPNNFDFGEDGMGIGLILIKQYCDINYSKATFENKDGVNSFLITMPSHIDNSVLNYN